MKKIKYFIVLIVSVLILSSCSNKPKNDSDFVGNIKSSIKEVNSVNIVATVNDQGIEVYKLEQNISVTSKTENSCTGEILKTTYSLSDGFEIAEKSQTTYFTDADLTTLFNFNINNEFFVNAPTIDGQVLTGEIAEDKANDFFSTNNLRNNGTVSVSFTLSEGNKIESYSITYTTTTNKAVAISGSYSYE